MSLSCQKHLFSLPPDEHYLNCAYMGPLPKATEAAGIAGVRRKSAPRSITTREFFDQPDLLRERFGTLIGTTGERVALVPSASYGVAIAAQNLPLRRGQNVVLPGEEFPSDVYAWMDLCGEVGAELRIVPRPVDAQRPGQTWNERMLDAIDANTAVVILTAVHWTDGTRFDLAAIGARAREVGALYVVDGTQSVGALPFDWEQVRPDLLVCAGYKWLLGPYQLGLVAVGERLLEGRPFERTWIGREGAEDFANLVHYRTGFRPGARRFDVGEHSNPITVPMLLASLDQIMAWGVDAIQAYCAGLGGVLQDALGETHGFTVAPPEERAAHLFGVRLPDAAAIPEILEHLAARKVYVSQRGASLRVSPHVYNTPDDMAALADALKAAVR